jgi:SAM-dependent methyltransferase
VTAAVLAAPRADALTIFDRALTRAATGRRAILTLRDDLGAEHRIDPAPWCRPHLPGDAGLLRRCAGPTLDVGCGPGRLTRALARIGCPALGIDVSAAAVRLTRRGGGAALRRDVFGPLPGHGRWRHVLLADGNIGIGGDPVALLRRCGELLARDGRLHVEVAAPGTRSWAGNAVLSAGGGTAPLRWAVVAAGDLAAVAETAGFRTSHHWTEAGRWFTTLTRT